MAHQQLWFVFLFKNRRVGEVNSMKIGFEGLHPSSFPLKKALIEFRIYLGRRGEREIRACYVCREWSCNLCLSRAIPTYSM